MWEGKKMRCSERIEKECPRKETVKIRVCRETKQMDKRSDRVAHNNSRRRKIQVSDKAGGRILQWNSSNINSESSTAGSHYVGEMQVSPRLTSNRLSVPDRTPLITPWGLYRVLETLALV